MTQVEDDQRQIEKTPLIDVLQRNRNYINGFKDSVLKIQELSMLVAEKGTIPVRYGGTTEVNMNSQRVKQMMKETLKTLDSYWNMAERTYKKYARAKKRSGGNKAVFSATAMNNDLIEAIRSLLNRNTGMDELLAMMPSQVWTDILQGTNVTDPRTTRTLLMALIHLMLAIYGQKPQRTSPMIMMSGAPFEASQNALRGLEANIREKRNSFMRSLLEGSFPTTKPDGKPIKDFHENYKTFLDSVRKTYLSSRAQNANDPVVVLLGPLATDFIAAKRDKRVRDFIDGLINGGFARYLNQTDSNTLVNVLAQIRFPFTLTDTSSRFKNEYVHPLITEYTSRLSDTDKRVFYDPNSKELVLTQAGQLNALDRRILSQVREITVLSRELTKVQTGNNNFTDANKRKLLPEDYERYVVGIPRESIMMLYDRINGLARLDAAPSPNDIKNAIVKDPDLIERAGNNVATELQGMIDAAKIQASQASQQRTATVQPIA